MTLVWVTTFWHGPSYSCTRVHFIPSGITPSVLMMIIYQFVTICIVFVIICICIMLFSHSVVTFCIDKYCILNVLSMRILVTLPMTGFEMFQLLSWSWVWSPSLYVQILRNFSIKMNKQTKNQNIWMCYIEAHNQGDIPDSVESPGFEGHRHQAS